ncbi:MAG: hypothetical protein LUC43_06545 [Burkholderiales bacterium]|nr:hypothetical protein [Burkholderiales bacterium]
MAREPHRLDSIVMEVSALIIWMNGGRMDFKNLLPFVWEAELLHRRKFGQSMVRPSVRSDKNPFEECRAIARTIGSLIPTSKTLDGSILVLLPENKENPEIVFIESDSTKNDPGHYLTEKARHSAKMAFATNLTSSLSAYKEDKPPVSFYKTEVEKILSSSLDNHRIWSSLSSVANTFNLRHYLITPVYEFDWRSFCQSISSDIAFLAAANQYNQQEATITNFQAFDLCLQAEKVRQARKEESIFELLPIRDKNPQRLQRQLQVAFQSMLLTAILGIGRISHSIDKFGFTLKDQNTLVNLEGSNRQDSAFPSDMEKSLVTAQMHPLKLNPAGLLHYRHLVELKNLLLKAKDFKASPPWQAVNDPLGQSAFGRIGNN